MTITTLLLSLGYLISRISKALPDIRELIKDLKYRNEQAEIAAKLANKLLRRLIESQYPATKKKHHSVEKTDVSVLARKKSA